MSSVSRADPNELSQEGVTAFKIALSVLTEGNTDAASSDEAQLQDKPPAGEGDAVSRPASLELGASVSADATIPLRHISSRNEIALSENHVLVMWGLSTYRAEHPRGVTFVVDNSRANRDRD